MALVVQSENMRLVPLITGDSTQLPANYRWISPLPPPVLVASNLFVQSFALASGDVALGFNLLEHDDNYVWKFVETTMTLTSAVNVGFPSQIFVTARYTGPTTATGFSEQDFIQHSRVFVPRPSPSGTPGGGDFELQMFGRVEAGTSLDGDYPICNTLGPNQVSGRRSFVEAVTTVGPGSAEDYPIILKAPTAFRSVPSVVPDQLFDSGARAYVQHYDLAASIANDSQFIGNPAASPAFAFRAPDANAALNVNWQVVLYGWPIAASRVGELRLPELYR